MAGKKKPYKWVERAVVISALRRSFMRYPPAKEIFDAAKEVYYVKSKKGKELRRVKFKCSSCGKFFNRKDIRLDHLEAVVDPKVGFVSYDEFAKRLFCDKSNLQLICKEEHDKKSKEENRERRKTKQRNNPSKNGNGNRPSRRKRSTTK